MKTDTTEVVVRLVREFGYPESGAALVAQDIAALRSPVREAFWEWWRTGAISDLLVEGYAAPQLIREHGLNPIAAWLTMGWLLEEPDEAKAALIHGYDVVTLGNLPLEGGTDEP